jgi:hypothetical protein
MASLRRLSYARFLLLRTLLVPSCRLPLARVLAEAARVSDGLAAIACRRGHRLVRLPPEWYGSDPIHVRRRLWRPVWRTILLGEAAATDRAGRGAFWEALQLYRLPPERRRLFGRERVVPQSGFSLPHGGRVWLF